MDLATLLLPAALVLGAPSSLGSFERGLFCDTVALIEFVVARTDRGDDPERLVKEINTTLDRRACIYATKLEVGARTLNHERNISANRNVYSIYKVEVTAVGSQTTEGGNVYWKFTQPPTMYTIRAAPSGR